MDSIIKKSLKQSISYEAYRELMRELVEKQSTTGADKSEAFVNHTKLNDRRMKRWDKTIKLQDEDKSRILKFDRDVTWLVIAESWCGDAAHVLPVLNKIAEANPHIELKVVLRDDNLELMDNFLTNGGRSIPKLIMLDKVSGDVLGQYGPRPSQATNYVNRYKAKYGTLTPEFKEDLQHWYNNDKGKNIINDITELLLELESV